MKEVERRRSDILLIPVPVTPANICPSDTGNIPSCPPRMMRLNFVLDYAAFMLKVRAIKPPPPGFRRGRFPVTRGACPA